MGFALLFALSALAAFSAMAVAIRARLRGRAEILVAATMIWNALIVAPIYALGLTSRLRPQALALGSLVTSLVAFGLASAGVGVRGLARETARAVVAQLKLPFEALALSWRPRSFVFVGVLFSVLLLPYLALSAYLGQAMAHWDPLWYHDTIVGFTIQNHGFSMVDLPDTLQKVNGYVRLAEMTQLWFVIFTDRRLADMTNLFFAPAIVAATYVLSRRYTSRVLALGWGVAVLLMPACISYMHSTYVDPQNAALVLGAILFSTLERPRLRDGALASLGLALAIGSKGLALVSVPVAGVIGAGLLLREHWRRARRSAIAVVVGGAILVLATASATYLRNYRAFHNPFWPDMTVDLPSLKIHWPGQGPWGSDSRQQGLPVNLNESLPRLLGHLYALPWSVKGMYFDQAVEYGVGIVWVALPLGVLAFVTCLVVALRRRLGHFVAEASPPLLVALILAVMIAGSPALWGPRYHTAHVALLVTLVAWFTRRRGWERVAESAVSAVIVTSLMMFWWTPDPRWWFAPERLIKEARATPLTRELDRDLGAPTILAVGLAREKELTAGKLLVFNERYAGFPSLFWNNTFSNRVQFLRSGPGFLARAAKANATWVFLAAGDPVLPEARATSSGWQEVGELNPLNVGYAFRWVGARTPAPAPPPKPAPRPYGPPAPPTVRPPSPPLRPRAEVGVPARSAKAMMPAVAKPSSPRGHRSVAPTSR